MTRIIGLLGPAGAGKSTIASHLVDKYGAKRYRLAGLLKEIAKRTLDLSDEQVDGTQAQKETVDPRYGFTPRWFLQRLGTEGVRNVLGQDFWTHQLGAMIANDAPDVAVIEDVRFVNEARILRESGAIVWRIELPEGAASTSIDPGKHSSETEWLRAEHDVVIRPAAYGIANLLACVDSVIYDSPRPLTDSERRAVAKAIGIIPKIPRAEAANTPDPIKFPWRPGDGGEHAL